MTGDGGFVISRMEGEKIVKNFLLELFIRPQWFKGDTILEVGKLKRLDGPCLQGRNVECSRIEISARRGSLKSARKARRNGV